MKLILIVCLVAVVLGEVYFEEHFDDSWEDRWVVSGRDSEKAGIWEVRTDDWYGDAEEGKGLQTTQDAKFYAISADMGESFSNDGKDLVVQFSVQFPQKIDCGGGYIKLLPDNLDQSDFGGDSEYAIMFGPDICGTSTKKVHVIFNYKGENLLTTNNIRCETDQLTHVYTLIVHPDNTYEVRIDGNEKASGSLYEDWDFLPPAEIKDPDQSKPDDWVDEKKIADPEASKPDDWVTVAKIPSPDAEKPEDWDDELDGDWEAPMIDNPEYKGEWHAPLIDNPEYIGEWEHPMIPNPDYEEDSTVYLRNNLRYVGIELWQVKSGTLFDNIIVTDDIAEADRLFEETWSAHSEAEKSMFKEIEDEKKAKKEEERKRKKAEREAQEKELEELELDDDDFLDDLHDEL